MTPLLAALAGMTLVAGVVAVAFWFASPAEDGPARSSTGLWTTVVDRLRMVDRRTWLMLAIGVAGGLALWVWTGWPLMLAVVPLATVGLPSLLGRPRQVEIELLQALDRWVRGMTATIAAGKSITDALRASARQAPPLIAEPLVVLVRRIDDRWTPASALLAFADDLASADADAVIASLILAVQRGGSGAHLTLSALADSIQDRLKALREIEAERAKPRAVVQQVTVITLVVLGAALVMGRDFFAPYGTPAGQAILAGLVAAYVGSLAALRRMTLPRRRARILRSA